MKCPEGIRQCPHNWTDCDLCANMEKCKSGMYKPEEEAPESDIEVVVKAATISEKVRDSEVQKNADSIRGTWMEKFDQMTEEERLAEFMRYRPPSLHEKEAIPLDGPSRPGGGSHCKVPPKPPYKTPEYLKNWGNDR